MTAIEIDEIRADRLRRSLPAAKVICADVLRYPLRTPVIVGNIPFHLTTPILRRLLNAGSWQDAVLLTQWEVARKRAGVGGATMMTAQAAPWFTFTLHGRVSSSCFTPRPSVDGGILGIQRRGTPLLPDEQRRGYEHFVRSVFTGRGGKLARIVERATGRSGREARRAVERSGASQHALPRDLEPAQWTNLWTSTRR